MLLPSEYFARYGNIWRTLTTLNRTWHGLGRRPIQDIYPPFYRFKNYDSFRQAHRRYRQGERPTQIILQMEICLL